MRRTGKSHFFSATDKEKKRRKISKWDKLGFLDDLNGHVKENIAQLYESEASHLLNEEEFTVIHHFSSNRKS